MPDLRWVIASLLLSACSLSSGHTSVTSPTSPRTTAQPGRAECAWVLWFTTATGVGGVDVASTPAGAYTTAKECGREADRARKTVLADHMKKYPRDTISATCLPDTIDLRKPKGAGR
jgi:hypothetical protein